MQDLPCAEWPNTDSPEKLGAIVIGAGAIFQFIQKRNRERYLLGHGDLKDWHLKLFKDVVPVSYYAGRYRSVDSARPCLNVAVHVNGVYGAPPSDVGRLMSQFSTQMQTYIEQTDQYFDQQTDRTLRLQSAAQMAAIAAAGIIQIHPFLNGNGRIARLTANFFFNRYGFRMPFYVERPLPGTEYGPASAAAMSNGDPVPLYRYFVTLLAS